MSDENNNNQPNIKKRVVEIDKQERSCSVYREELKARCSHTGKDGNPTIRSLNRGDDQLVFECRQCKKTVTVKQHSEAEVQQAIKVLDDVIDVIKMTANKRNEKDVKIIGRMGKTQFRLRNEIMGLYQAALKSGNKNSNRDHRQDGGGGMWGKAQIR